MITPAFPSRCSAGAVPGKLNRVRLAGIGGPIATATRGALMTLQTLDQLNRLRDDMPGVMEEVMQLFVTDAPRQLSLIEQAYEAGNAEELRQNAHYLRSGALALRLEWLAEQAHRLEFLAANEFNQPASDRLLEGLRTELGGVIDAISRELGDA